MEDKIKDELNKIYKNLKIEVKYQDIRIYQIILTISINNIEIIKFFNYQWDSYYTLDMNIRFITHKINTKILEVFRKHDKEEN